MSNESSKPQLALKSKYGRRRTFYAVIWTRRNTNTSSWDLYFSSTYPTSSTSGIVSVEEQEDDGEAFAEKMTRLTSELSELFVRSHELEGEIRKRLEGIGYDIWTRRHPRKSMF